jgi:hypothetical protein
MAFNLREFNNNGIFLLLIQHDWTIFEWNTTPEKYLCK